MSKIMNHLLQEAEENYDGDFERSQKEKELEELRSKTEQNEERIRELEVELGKKEPVEKFDFLRDFPKPKYTPNIPKRYEIDEDLAYEEWVDAKVERGEF